MFIYSFYVDQMVALNFLLIVTYSVIALLSISTILNQLTIMFVTNEAAFFLLASTFSIPEMIYSEFTACGVDANGVCFCISTAPMSID